MTDELQLARAKKHSPGFAAYLEARAALEADKPTSTPPAQTLEDKVAAIPPERRDPHLEAIRTQMRHEPETGDTA